LGTDLNEYVAITYMFLKQGKWKTKTEVIESDMLSSYEKFRILDIIPMDDYYRSLEEN